MLMAHPADLNIMYAGELFRNDKKYISAKQVSADPLCPQVAVQAWRVRGGGEKKLELKRSACLDLFAPMSRIPYTFLNL